jgi:two-component system sensor histidine kinase DesK
MTEALPEALRGSRPLRSAYGALFGFLAFIGFPLADLASDPPGTAELVVVVAGVAAFAAIYLWLMMPGPLDRTPRVRLGITALFSLSVALSLGDDPRWLLLFIYTAAAAGMLLSGRERTVAVAMCPIGLAAVGAATGYDAGVTFSLAISALAIGFMMSAFSRLITANAQLRAARQEIARLAVTDERLRFARDLHDLLGHSLSVIALKSELAGKLVASSPERAGQELADIRTVSQQALAEVREAVVGYRRVALAAELAGARAALTAAGIDCEVGEPEVALPEETESVLAWAVREGTTNVVRHSRASRCSICVRAGERDAEVEVVDDGVGPNGSREGAGLAGLVERAERVQGHVETGPRPGGGFRLRVTVPTVAGP